MVFKGVVTSIEGSKARVTFKDKNNIVSSLLKKANHIGELFINDEVTVVFFNGMDDGLIIAKF